MLFGVVQAIQNAMAQGTFDIIGCLNRNNEITELRYYDFLKHVKALIK